MIELPLSSLTLTQMVLQPLGLNLRIGKPTSEVTRQWDQSDSLVGKVLTAQM